LLSAAQMIKHVEFSKHLLNHWGDDPKGKYLWIHWDEKWFWGHVNRHAKVCEQLGLEPQQRFAFHKNHINKVMGIAVIYFAFEGSPNNGGVGGKIAFSRVQATKIAAKRQRAATKNASTGAIEYKGAILREAGDPYSVDCAVTGSNVGTSYDPKFALTEFFPLVMDEVEKLVKPGGKFAGYKPVFQGDRAGPHIEDKFLKYVTDECEKRKWLWEPQAPQMPHLNANDLGAFPAMSKRHTRLTRESGSMVPSKQVIWNAAVQVWNTLPASVIARR